MGLGMQSHAGLTIMSYALLNAPQDLEIFRLLYVTDVEDILNREFNEEDQEVGIRLIFDNSRMAKEWKKDLAIEYGHDCAACFHDDSFCHIREPYRRSMNAKHHVTFLMVVRDIVIVTMS